jgi:hypothetical protein
MHAQGDNGRAHCRAGNACSLAASWTLTLDMAPDSRWERLQLAALRLREIQKEADAIYRTFPELDRRPKIARAHPPRVIARRNAVIPAKLH